MNRTLKTTGECPVRIPVGTVVLHGDLCSSATSRGIIIFAHGSGSSRHSPRNRYVAGDLHKAGLATLLFDLLTAEEEAVDDVTARLRFDIRLLATRLIAATDWLIRNTAVSELPVGYFGASTGAAAALIAASERPETVRAIVSRGGRPDLAGPVLEEVKAPTLLIVGGRDDVVIRMNSEALDRLQVEKKLVVVPGATHLFEEPGALEEVSRLAKQWFLDHLGGMARQ